jgi:hypothetical protein
LPVVEVRLFVAEASEVGMDVDVKLIADGIGLGEIGFRGWVAGEEFFEGGGVALVVKGLAGLVEFGGAPEVDGGVEGDDGEG